MEIQTVFSPPHFTMRVFNINWQDKNIVRVQQNSTTPNRLATLITQKNILGRLLFVKVIMLNTSMLQAMLTSKVPALTLTSLLETAV